MLDWPPIDGNDQPDGLDALLEAIRRDGDFALVLCWVFDAVRHTAYCIAGTHGGKEHDARVLRYNRRLRLRAADAIPVRVVRMADSVWHADLTAGVADPRCERIRMAGYGACGAVPFRIDGAVIGAIEVFVREAGPEHAELFARVRQRIAQASGVLACATQRTPPPAGRTPDSSILPPVLQPFMEQELRLLFRSAPLGIVVTDEDEFIVEANARFCEMFDLTETDIIGMSFPALLQPDNPLPASTAYRDVRDGRLPRAEMEKRYHTGDRTVDVRLYLTGMTIAEGDAQGWYCMRLIEDISERRRLREQLQMAEAQRSDELQLFALRLQKAQEEERRRIASDLHDDLCQQLSGMKLSIEVFEDDVRANSEHAYQRLQLLKSQLERMIGTVRRMSSSLRPSVLDDFGLLPALRVMAKEQQELHGLQIAVHAEGYEHAAALHEQETALYRIVQEALSNIVHHAEASDARIDLIGRDREIALHIRDNGIGFSPTEVRYSESDMRGMGLVGMRERARQLRGSMEIQSLPGSGTEIIVRLPYPERT